MIDKANILRILSGQFNFLLERWQEQSPLPNIGYVDHGKKIVIKAIYKEVDSCPNLSIYEISSDCWATDEECAREDLTLEDLYKWLKERS